LSQLLQSLLNLQRLDDALLDMERVKEEIPIRILAFEKELEEAENKLETDKKRLQEATRTQRRIEKELEEGQEQLKKKQSRRFEVKTNDEYRAILKEIEYTQQAHSQMEDQILRLFEENEALEKEVRRQEKEVERLSAGLRLEKERSRNETVNVTQEHQRVSQERTVVSNLIHQEVLAEYEKLRKRRSGLAVVVVHSDICPGCHMAIPFQTINEVLQTGEIRHCPYCRRILFCEN
jgi:hypothetical protein